MKQETRYIALSDESGMGGELIILQTNAPAKRLKALEKESCEIYTNGDYEDVPIWPSVLEDEGYECSIIDSHQHVTPYDTQKNGSRKNILRLKSFTTSIQSKNN